MKLTAHAEQRSAGVIESPAHVWQRTVAFPCGLACLPLSCQITWDAAPLQPRFADALFDAVGQKTCPLP